MADDGRESDRERARAGKRVMYVIAGTALIWALATEIGRTYDWPSRVRGLFDLLALAGFALGLWMTYQLWQRRNDRDRDGDDRNGKR